MLVCLLRNLDQVQPTEVNKADIASGQIYVFEDRLWYIIPLFPTLQRATHRSPSSLGKCTRHSRRHSRASTNKLWNCERGWANRRHSKTEEEQHEVMTSFPHMPVQTFPRSKSITSPPVTRKVFTSRTGTPPFTVSMIWSLSFSRQNDYVELHVSTRCWQDRR